MHASICDLVLDLVQNSIEAAAQHIRLTMQQNSNQLNICIQDDGSGMDPVTVQQALDPFYTNGIKHRSRKVGLGLPFLKQVVEATEGQVHIDSMPGEGTTISLSLHLDHIDMPPMGNVPSTCLALMNYPGAFELVIDRTRDGRSYSVARSELQEALGSMETAQDLLLARTYLRQLEEDLNE